MRESLRAGRPVRHLTDMGYQGHVAGVRDWRVCESENMADTEPKKLSTVSGRARARKELSVKIQDGELR